MDAIDLPEAEYAAVLGDLARVNRWTMAARPTLAFLNRAARDRGALRILDVGFGHGDMLRRVARWGERSGTELDLVGIDLNHRSAPIAIGATPPTLRIDYRTGDYADLAGQRWDIVLSSLVAHHMSADELTNFLRFMEREARVGWFINDLHRRWLPHLAYPWLARALGVRRIVREDGTLSIARSYRPAEWATFLSRAGIDQARVLRAFPYRLCVERRR